MHDPRLQAISQAAKELVEQRDRWLNAEGLTSEAEKKKRTLTNLYNARPTWLDLATSASTLLSLPPMTESRSKR